jgi:demethylmenaquinone methyltransferase/2-methoxy-6-polyprenyl-1,4-benzoquinol methylase
MPPVDAAAVPTIAPHPPIPRFYEHSDQKRQFVRQLFDRSAGNYDRIERMMALGSGPWYRRSALLRAGLANGMRVLDVAAGTGLVTREAAAIVGNPKLVLGVDPSPGMLAEAATLVPQVNFAIGTAEALPLPDASVDFLSMGYALRHVSDLSITFREYSRVLRPGGKLCILEITRPTSRLRLHALQLYMRWIVPLFARLTTRTRGADDLWSYYWDTIEQCLPPQQILNAMNAAGFINVSRRVELGIFSEYTGRKTS